MARKRKQEEEDNPLRWLATYGDVVTLMLAFFIMLYAISQVDQQKFLLFVSGLQDPFGNPAIKQGILNEGDGIVGEASIDIQEAAVSASDVALLDGLPELTPSDEPAEGEDGDGAGEIGTAEELAQLQAELTDALAAADLGDAVDFTIDERGLVVAIATDSVLFASGSAEFGERGEEILAALAPTLAEIGNDVMVEGHTDTVPLGGPGYDNWNLSQDRALAVLRRLVSPHGLAPERLAATGFGEFRPRASNETTDGKAANRRVELVVVVERGGIDG